MSKEKKPEEKKTDVWKWTPPKPGQKIAFIDKEFEYKPKKPDEKKGKK